MPRQAKRYFKHAQNAQIYIHPTHAQSRIRLFALHWYILWCLTILLVDNEDPDRTARTARMRRLISAFVVRICPKTSFLYDAVDVLHVTVVFGGYLHLYFCMKKLIIFFYFIASDEINVYPK